MKVAVIAGANRGIGFALVDALARSWSGTGTVYLTTRNDSDGASATERLRAKGLPVEWLRFDLSDPASPFALAKILRQRHGVVDVAALNGAYAPRAGTPAVEDARPMIEANSHGSLRFLRAFQPILNENSRVVIVASGFGTLASIPENLRPAFNTNNHGVEDIDRAMDGYVGAVENGTAAAGGWPEWVKIPSKVGQVAVTRTFAREFARIPDRLKAS